MHAKAAGGQLHQGFDVVALQFARRRHFLEFFSHKVSYRSRPPRGMALLKIVSGKKPREIAVQILGRRTGGEFIEDLLDRALAARRLSPADRHLCQELVYGIVRWQATLDWLIARKTAEPPPKAAAAEPACGSAFTRSSGSTASPTMPRSTRPSSWPNTSGFGPQAGFVNAVLRGYLREFDATRQLLAELKTQPAAPRLFPPRMAGRHAGKQRWGAEATAQLLAWNNTPPADLRPRQYPQSRPGQTARPMARRKRRIRLRPP